MDLEIKGWIERYPAKVITTFSRLYCSIISRGDFSSKIESLHQNVSQKGIIWPSKIQLEASKSEKKWLEDGLQDSPISASKKKRTRGSSVGEGSSSETTFGHVKGFTWHQPSTTTAPWCRVPHQIRWCQRGYLRNKKAEVLVDYGWTSTKRVVKDIIQKKVVRDIIVHWSSTKIGGS